MVLTRPGGWYCFTGPVIRTGGGSNTMKRSIPFLSVALLLGLSTALMAQFQTRPRGGGGIPSFGRQVMYPFDDKVAAINKDLDAWVNLVGRWPNLQAQVVKSAARWRAKVEAIKGEHPVVLVQGKNYFRKKEQSDKLDALRQKVSNIGKADAYLVPLSKGLRLKAEGFGKVKWKDPAIQRRIEKDLNFYRTESAAIEIPWVTSDGETKFDVPRFNAVINLWNKNTQELDPATGTVKGQASKQ